MEIIEYGDPDGAGRDTLKYIMNCLRAEASLLAGVLDLKMPARV